MNERISKLRQQSTSTKPFISTERAQLVTEFYKSDEAQKVSIPVKRAMTFRHILTNKKIHINDGELIVGERGPEPQATPTYPEITLHSVADLEILKTRKTISFGSDEETKRS
jgi:formate C-acetyltransferase